MMHARLALGLLLAGCAPWATAAAGARQDCAALARVNLPQARIVSAASVAAGDFVPQGTKPGTTLPSAFRNVPAFCRVQAVLTPSSDSSIKVEVWMPERGWNGRLRGQGNGGFAGSIDYGGLAAAVRQGYASASTDTGHAGGDAAWALGHPEKIIDFGYRAIHLMTLDAKTLVQAFYGKPAAHAYFASCSNGGRQALMEAQRHPDDYDGIIAGAPAYDWTRLLTHALGVMQQADSATGYIPQSGLSLLAHAVLAACDADDGVIDGVLGDPRRCRFDPAALACRQPTQTACLTAAQLATLRTIRDGARDGAGRQIHYGTLPGAEDAPGGWLGWLFGPEPGANMITFFARNYFADMVYDDPHWDYRNANLDDALALAERKTGAALDATDADLEPFVARGGRLILFHGWNDPAISPLGTIAYHDALAGVLGPRRMHAAVRLYMVPGMLHCDGGAGAHAFGQNSTDARADAGHDIFAALVQWVERGHAPDVIVARRPADGARAAATRPLCPYPRVARFDGKGDRNRATAFACAAPPSSGAQP